MRALPNFDLSANALWPQFILLGGKSDPILDTVRCLAEEMESSGNIPSDHFNALFEKIALSVQSSHKGRLPISDLHALCEKIQIVPVIKLTSDTSSYEIVCDLKTSDIWAAMVEMKEPEIKASLRKAGISGEFGVTSISKGREIYVDSLVSAAAAHGLKIRLFFVSKGNYNNYFTQNTKDLPFLHRTIIIAEPPPLQNYAVPMLDDGDKEKVPATSFNGGQYLKHLEQKGDIPLKATLLLGALVDALRSCSSPLPKNLVQSRKRCDENPAVSIIPSTYNTYCRQQGIPSPSVLLQFNGATGISSFDEIAILQEASRLNPELAENTIYTRLVLLKKQDLDQRSIDSINNILDQYSILATVTFTRATLSAIQDKPSLHPGPEVVTL